MFLWFSEQHILTVLCVCVCLSMQPLPLHKRPIKIGIGIIFALSTNNMDANMYTSFHNHFVVLKM